MDSTPGRRWCWQGRFRYVSYTACKVFRLEARWLGTRGRSIRCERRRRRRRRYRHRCCFCGFLSSNSELLKCDQLLCSFYCFVCVCDWFIGLIDALLTLSLCRLFPTALLRYALLRRLRTFILGPAGPFFLSAEFRRHFYTDQSKKDRILLGLAIL